MTRNFASLVVFASVLWGQSAAPTKPGKVEGTVINSVTNDPVKKAAVILQALAGRANYSAVTDATGHFHFESVDPGRYQAIGIRDGFRPLEGNRFNAMAKPVTVSAEQEVKDVVVKLLPLAVVNGHVLDEDGDPLVWSQVQALRYVYGQGGVRQLQPTGFATTNDLGEFQLLDLEPGRYYFLAVARPRLERLPPNTKSATPEQAYPKTFYPSASEAEQSTATVVAAGAQVSGIDFHLREAPAFHIRGKAVDIRNGEVIRNGNVHVQTHMNMFFQNARVRQNGTFDLPGMSSGSYLLILQSPDRQLSVRQNIEVGDHDINDAVLVLRPQVEISGSIRLESAPPPSVHRGPMRVNLMASGIGASATEVNADGSFALKATPAVYEIYASCDAGAYVKSIHFGDQDLTGRENRSDPAIRWRAKYCMRHRRRPNPRHGSKRKRRAGRAGFDHRYPGRRTPGPLGLAPRANQRSERQVRLPGFRAGRVQSVRLGRRRRGPADAPVHRISQGVRKPRCIGNRSAQRQRIGAIEADFCCRYRSRKEQAAMIRILLSAAIVVCVLAAQEPPARLFISGIVISTSGEPVRKARVILRAKDETAFSYAAASDANGRFAIQDVQPGDYFVGADRPGFTADDNGVPGAPPPTLKVEAGRSVSDLKIRLIPLAVVTGRVLDDDGDPIRGAQVEAMAYGYQTGKKELDTQEQASANDKGEFRLFALTPGTIYLRASAENRPRFTSDNSATVSFTPTFFPSTTNAALASAIDLSAGAQLSGFDIRLRRERHYSVRGTLPDVFKHEGAQTMLQILSRDGSRESTGLQQNEETFEFQDVIPGSYVIIGNVMHGGKRSVLRQAVEVGNADVEGVTLNFAPPVNVSGTVRIEGALSRPLEKVQIILAGDIFGQHTAEVKSDGTFAIPEVMPEMYRVIIRSQPGAYMKSIRLGDEDVSGGRIDLTKESGSLTIVLATDVGDVEGSVKKANGDPAVRVRVTLIAGRSDLSRYEFTDEQGKFHMREVPPGEYKAFAWSDAPFGAPQDPDFRKPFEKHAVAVKLDPNGHATVDLTAISVKAVVTEPRP